MIEKLKKFGWTSEDLPETYIFKSHPKSNKIWVAGQCPPGLTRERQLEWNRLVCRIAVSDSDSEVGRIRTKLKDLSYIQTDKETERGLKKANLSHAIFDLKKHALIDPVVDTVFGKSISVGDAAETPNFFNAEGIANALADSFNVGVDIELPYRTLARASDDSAEPGKQKPPVPPKPATLKTAPVSPPQSAQQKMAPPPVPPKPATLKTAPVPPPPSTKPKTVSVRKSFLDIISRPFQMLKTLWNKIR